MRILRGCARKLLARQAVQAQPGALVALVTLVVLAGPAGAAVPGEEWPLARAMRGDMRGPRTAGHA